MPKAKVIIGEVHSEPNTPIKHLKSGESFALNGGLFIRMDKVTAFGDHYYSIHMTESHGMVMRQFHGDRLVTPVQLTITLSS